MSDPSFLYGRPTAAELLESVREWIERDVMTQTSGRLQFHARVAVNVLSMIEREMSLGDVQRTAHHDRLASFGAGSDAELSSLIRSGALDDRAADVRIALLASAEDQLRVANPKHLVVE
jgi:hypothetical protein